jgi:hypothetical protein
MSCEEGNVGEMRSMEQSTLNAVFTTSGENLADHMESCIESYRNCTHQMTFGCMSDALHRVDTRFSDIDRNHDGRITVAELREYNFQNSESYDPDIVWVLCHYAALAKASLIPHEAIESGDLKQASRVFRGLAYVQQYFNCLTGEGYKKVYPEDLLRIVCGRERLSSDEAAGIWHLIHYLLHLSRERNYRHTGLTKSELSNFSPEDIFGTEKNGTYCY